MRNHTDMPCLQEAVYQDGRRKERDSKLGELCCANLVWLGKAVTLTRGCQREDTCSLEGVLALPAANLLPTADPGRTPLTQR